ncbi:phosphotransferase family protein [Actinoplanes sp. GCM10030250]|uniref:phosphotransferase family protein n=1 Tax=Actinoplanes sp. GCM10030250 TaxID=3273376 RepID=UPI0036154871
MPHENSLPGGFIAAPVRIGGTVRKPPVSAFVHGLLHHFEQHDWPGAPRYRGADDQGRDTFTFLRGDVPWQPEPTPYVRSPAALTATARLVRRFHDLTAGTALAADQEVVCHNDLSPKNTVYRDAEPVAFIDWDIAAPGRIHDVAHVCWQFLGLGPAVSDPAEAAALVAVIAQAYGGLDQAELVDTILWWQDRCGRGIDSGANAGEPAMIRLWEQGAVQSVRSAYEWTLRHRAVLAHATPWNLAHATPSNGDKIDVDPADDRSPGNAPNHAR